MDTLGWAAKNGHMGVAKELLKAHSTVDGK
jgi:hypothetical protein